MKSDDLKSGPKKLKTASEHGIQAPLALLAELSHRCPLQCPYCSNPVQLESFGPSRIDYGRVQLPGGLFMLFIGISRFSK